MTGSPTTRGGGGRPWTTQGGRGGEGGPGPGLKSTFGWQVRGCSSGIPITTTLLTRYPAARRTGTG